MIKRMKKKYNDIPQEEIKSFEYTEQYNTLIEREYDLKNNKLEEEELLNMKRDIKSVMENIEKYIIQIEDRKPKLPQSIVREKNKSKLKDEQTIERIRKDFQSVETVLKCVKNSSRNSELLKLIYKYKDNSTMKSEVIESDVEEVKVYIYI